MTVRLGWTDCHTFVSHFRVFKRLPFWPTGLKLDPKQQQKQQQQQQTSKQTNLTHISLGIEYPETIIILLNDKMSK